MSVCCTGGAAKRRRSAPGARRGFRRTVRPSRSGTCTSCPNTRRSAHSLRRSCRRPCPRPCWRHTRTRSPSHATAGFEGANGRAAHVRSSYHGSAPEAEVLETVAQTSAPAYATSASTVSSGLWAVMVCDGGLSPHPAQAPQLRGHCVAQSFGLQRDRQTEGASQLSRNCTQTVEPGGAPSRLTWKLPSIDTVGSFGGLADSSAVALCNPSDAWFTVASNRLCQPKPTCCLPRVAGTQSCCC